MTSIEIVDAPRPDSKDEDQAYLDGIRNGLTERQRLAFDDGDFVECTTCSAKSGSPVLCAPCLANRLTIGMLQKPDVRWDTLHHRYVIGDGPWTTKLAGQLTARPQTPLTKHPMVATFEADEWGPASAKITSAGHRSLRSQGATVQLAMLELASKLEKLAAEIRAAAGSDP